MGFSLKIERMAMPRRPAASRNVTLMSRKMTSLETLNPQALNPFRNMADAVRHNVPINIQVRTLVSQIFNPLLPIYTTLPLKK